MIKNLVLTGNQLKGIGYLGILKVLYELDIISDIVNICGVSSGSIFAFLLCLQINPDSLISILNNIQISSLKDKNTDLFRLFENYGIDSGKKFTNVIKIILHNKLGNKNATFKDLHDRFPSHNLMIIGTNLSKKQMEIFSYKNTPNMKLHKAIRISISYPFIFDKIDYKNNIYVDGGLINNYPIEIFKDELPYTLGICIYSNNGNTNIDNLNDYIFRILSILTSRLQEYLIDKYNNNTIEIFLDINVFDTLSSNAHTDYIINESYKQFKNKLFDNKLFKKYINYKFLYKETYKIVNDIINNI